MIASATFDRDTLFEVIAEEMGDDHPISEEQFDNAIEELLSENFLKQQTYNEDEILYSAADHLQWSDFSHFTDQIKKSILYYLVRNPTVFFILFNTQKGKTNIVVKEMQQWIDHRPNKVVTFFVSDNDKTLAEQSSESIVHNLGQDQVKVFLLSSNSKDNVDTIRVYIDAYEADQFGDYPMPVIGLLANGKQLQKMLSLMAHIQNKVSTRGSKLRYGIIVDEADRIYPQIRDQKCSVKLGQQTVSRSLIDFVTDASAMHRIGFVSATDSDLLTDDYFECKSAYLYQTEIDPDTEVNYRALHSIESVVHRVPMVGRQNQNAYAMKILSEQSEHFKTPIRLRNGQTGYRKTIINSNPKVSDMAALARHCISLGMYAITFNQSGVKVYREGKVPETFATKGQRFNEVLFCVYKTLGLHDKPLVILGRRKVDRGIGFHFAPRSVDRRELRWLGNKKYPAMTVVSENGEGLIWTDMILGKVGDNTASGKAMAVQKAGRLAGIIAQCPQYSGEIHFWTDDATERRIRTHNEVVDAANALPGHHAMWQAMAHAENAVNARSGNGGTNVRAIVPDTDHHTFDTQEEAIKFAKATLGRRFNKRDPNEKIAEFASKNGGRNPTEEELLQRWWGIDEKNTARMLQTDQGKWCVYWRPTLVAAAKNKKNEDARSISSTEDEPIVAMIGGGGGGGGGR